MVGYGGLQVSHVQNMPTFVFSMAIASHWESQCAFPSWLAQTNAVLP